ncbi:Rrf2 family transcriptional regulator [Methylophilus sp.]|uniref:Rrf2 family transcriptional regulator n=1 Tax=Methylophilus sp. TaxID=29541 RepID=UPI0011D887F3|nr:Rrf2 family transcriptional regulator [Methylophilus sp.]TXI44435.1 MAG: Rrf2 family transcriptional regulator [Methylophilus sp.]
MQLNKFTDIGLRVLMYLSQSRFDQQVTIDEIATTFDLPRNHLIKVITRLNKLGWIKATRGRNGGLELNPESLQLRIGDILRELENTTELINCEKPVCRFHGGCLLKDALQTGLESFYAHMNQHSLFDIVNNNTREKIIAMHKTHAA